MVLKKYWWRQPLSQHHKAGTCKPKNQIERLVLEMRSLRRAWQTNRSPSSKQRLKEATNPNLSSPIETVTPIRNSSGSWVHSDEDRAETFALHLRNVFQPNRATGSFVLPQIVSESISPPPLFQPKQNAKVIGELKPKKAPGGDQITPKMLIELSNSAIEVICKLFNGIITLGYYPKKWKNLLSL